MNYTILQGDNRETMKTLADNSIDAIITDPPYGIDFLGKSWDANTGALETYQECLRVLKPGGYILAFSAARTYHHLAITLEQAGFEIRDQIMWIYSSGFPKSQDIGKQFDKKAGKKDPNYGTTKYSITSTEKEDGQSKYSKCKLCGKGMNGDTSNDCSNDPCGLKYTYQTEEGKQWSGWGTALKPAHEPIALARKPTKLSFADNSKEYGLGGLNIDATRIETTDKIQSHFNRNSGAPEFAGEEKNIVEVDLTISNKGRFPSNVIGEILQEDYQKYFYCPKVNRKERHIGYDTNNTATESTMLNDMGGYYIDEQGNETKVNGKNIWLPQTGNIYIHGLKEEYRKWCEANNITSNVGNNHPTVKPVELMKYLIKLITPPNSVVLDPFNGSGSTGMAAVELGHTYIGCELDPAYVEIASKRIEAWNTKDNNFNQLFKEE